MTCQKRQRGRYKNIFYGAETHPLPSSNAAQQIVRAELLILASLDMTRKRWIPGGFVRIPLSDGSYGYGRLRERPVATFYNFRTEEPLSDLNEIFQQPILFTVAVHKSIFSRWEVIGKKPLEDQMKLPFYQFWQDVGDYRNCRIFDMEGNERQVKPEECEGVERWAVWDPEHIEDRLLDTFLGKPNVWSEQLRVRYEDKSRVK